MKAYKTRNRAIYYRVILPLSKIGIKARVENRNVVVDMCSYVEMQDWKRTAVESVLFLSGMRFKHCTNRNKRPYVESVYILTDERDAVATKVQYVNPVKRTALQRFFSMFK